MEPKNDRTEKVTYTSPRLTRYGDIRQLTRTVGQMGNSDDFAGATKTG